MVRLTLTDTEPDDGSDLRCAYCGEKWPCANPGGAHMSIGELRARNAAADRAIAEAVRPHTKLPQFPKAERYALLMREAFAHAHDRASAGGPKDFGPLRNAANLCRVLAYENKGSDPIAEAFWTRTLQWLEEG